MSEILTLGPSVARFFETYLVHPKGERYGEAFQLEPWQRDFVDELYRVDADGRRLYRQALLGIPRGNGKTPLAAGIGLFELMARRDAPDVFNAAGSKDQARILTDFANAFVRQGKLRNWLTPRSRTIIHRESLGVMRLVSSEGRLQHGGSVSAAIGDELWAWTTDSQEEVWNAFWTAMHKRRDPLLLAITTAGHDRTTLLGRMYDDAWKLDVEERNVVEGVGPCLRIARDLENGILAWWYGPPDELVLEDAMANRELWRAVNPASWIEIATLEKQLAGLGFDEFEFARLHLNMWTQTRAVFIPQLAWRACVSAERQRRRRPLYIAVDVGLTHDTTAVSASQPLPDYEPARPPGKRRSLLEPKRDPKPRSPYVLSRVRIWSANPDHEHDRTACHIWVPGGRMDLELVEDYILALAKAYDLKEVVYDPTFFEGEAQRLAKQGIPVAPLYQNGVHPKTAAQQLYQDVKAGLALHAADKVLDKHVAAAAGIPTEGGWKISRLQSTAPIDGCVALAMSHWRASRYTGSIYDHQDVLVLGPDEDDE